MGVGGKCEKQKAYCFQICNMAEKVAKLMEELQKIVQSADEKIKDAKKAVKSLQTSKKQKKKNKKTPKVNKKTLHKGTVSEQLEKIIQKELVHHANELLKTKKSKKIKRMKSGDYGSMITELFQQLENQSTDMKETVDKMKENYSERANEVLNAEPKTKQLVQDLIRDIRNKAKEKTEAIQEIYEALLEE